MKPTSSSMAMWRAATRAQSFRMKMVAVAAATLWLATTACSAATATTTTTSASTTTTTGVAPNSSAPVTTVGIAGYVTVDGKRVAIPEEGDRPIQPIVGVGEQVIITEKAIEPHLLYCQVKYRLTFTNLTSVPQQLQFVNDGGWRSPKIPPGGTWHYTPKNGISYYYVTNTGLQARFQPSAPLPGNP